MFPECRAQFHEVPPGGAAQQERVAATQRSHVGSQDIRVIGIVEHDEDGSRCGTGISQGR